MVLTLSGSAAKAFSPGGRGESVMNAFRRAVIDPANALLLKAKSKARFTWRAFWLTAGADETPNYVKIERGAESWLITPPRALGLISEPSAEQLHDLYVGRELLALMNAHYDASRGWAEAWETPSRAEVADAHATRETTPAAAAEAVGELPF